MIPRIKRLLFRKANPLEAILDDFVHKVGVYPRQGANPLQG